MSESVYSPTARRAAGVIAVVAGVTLLTRFWLRYQQSAGALDALAYMANYFTILTNTLTFVVMLLIALGRDLPLRIVQAVMIAIVCVGLIYHALLAHLVSLSGLELWADHGTHTFVPILAGLWWVFLAPKPPFQVSDMALWVAWPLIYCAYILYRAQGSGFYPYPFLNLPEIGWTELTINVAGLSVGFVIVGFLLYGIGRVFSGGAKPTH